MTKNFIELITEYNILIPLIQRDFVQGRKKELDKANNFLNAIKNNLDNGLNLDFVYGKIDDNIFIPLDGQQRLTTLFLLHWYASVENNYLPSLTKFSYEVRSSTKDFIEKLTKKSNWAKLKKDDIKKSIENSNWFFLSWKNDPTVVSLLNMLHLIENKFKSIPINKFNTITFEVLYLDKFNLTDELYVKMNARGKPLSDFENFKAEFEKYIIFDDKKREHITKANFDNKWMEIFWNIAQDSINNSKRDISEAPKLADNIFFNFFYNITFTFYLESLKSLKCKVNNKYKDYKEIKTFVDECSIFDFYKNVYEDKENIKRIILILDNLQIDNIFKIFIREKDISQWERARFYALSLGYINNLDEKEFNRWKRVSFNLINNQLIQSPEDMIKTVKALKQLSDNCDKDIYGFIKNDSNNIEYFTKIQREEESLKSELIENDSNNWEQELINAESHWYLDGQIGFLIDFSNSNIDEFITYKDKFKALWDFSKENKDNQILIYQALLTKGYYLPQLGSNYTFCSFDGDSVRVKNDNWKKVFNSDKLKNSDNPDRKLFLKSLLNDTNFNKEDIKKSLETIVDNYKFQSDDSLSHLIKNKSYIKYCNKLQIRWKDKNNIRLLKKSQINGTHCELHSWNLFHKEFGLKPKANREVWWRLESDKIYEPFKTTWYFESTSRDKPCIVLDDLKFENKIIKLDIGYKDNGFYLEIYTEDGKLPKTITDKLVSIGFDNENVKNDIIYSNILKEIKNICDELK